MRDIIFTFFNYFVFFYTSMLAIFFVTFAFLSFISLKRRKDYYVESYMRKTIKESPYTPGISVIAPAFNEEKTIIDNVNSMLALEYPLFEVVIVNDGSTDSTLEKMTRIFLPGKLPLRKVQRSMHNSSIRVCSTMHRARLSSLPSLPSLQLQPLSSMRVSGESTPCRAEPTNSLSGRKVATRAD
jgi:hypothetical protein